LNIQHQATKAQRENFENLCGLVFLWQKNKGCGSTPLLFTPPEHKQADILYTQNQKYKKSEYSISHFIIIFSV